MDDYTHDDWEITEEDEAYFARLATEAAEMKVADYLAKHPQPLQNSNQLMAKFQQEIKLEADYTFDETVAGYKALAEGLPHVLGDLDDDESHRVRREYERWQEFMASISSGGEFLDTVLHSGKSLQEAFFLSNETMSYFYQVGRRYIQEGDYEKAKSLFFLLSHLNGGVYEFWLGLAIAYQETGDIEHAIAAYKKSKNIRENDPTVELFLADCFLDLNVPGEAEEHLHLAKEKMTKSHEYAFLKPKIKQISQKLKTLS